METSSAFSEFIGIIKSWIPGRSEPPNVSKNFWMPDHSCRVCYECDSQFTVFNRRHHCRYCGRIFCGKCTSNFVPASSDNCGNTKEDCERVRVCNFCFTQWEQRRPASDNALQQCLSPLSSTSFISTKSSGTLNSSATVGSYSTGLYYLAPYGPAQSFQSEPCSDTLEMQKSSRSIDAEIGNQFGYALNRGDRDYYDYGVLHDSETQLFQPYGDYGSSIEFKEVDQDVQPISVHPSEVRINLEDNRSTLHNLQHHANTDADKLEEDNENESSYESNASSIYELDNADAEPVDFENNGLLWLPPDPEDDDERDHILIDDDEEDPMGEKYDRSSNSFGSGECQTKERSSEEQKKAMKSVVDGHFRALIAQLLQVENLPIEDDDKGSWLDIVTSLSWEAAHFLKPDTSNVGGMDPGGCVKVKCLACGHRSESKVVRGVVCKKNVANKRMKSRIQKPRFLILGGALEYQRVANMLSSFDTLLQQEMDHLKMAVAKIAAHQPTVLLVEKSVSRFAQDYLLAKGISLVLNIKRSILEHIARCTGAQVVPSIDHLSSSMVGHCDLFHVEKYYEDIGTTGKGEKKTLKNLMFFEDCPKPLGCTVLLKGANIDELKKVKHVVQYGFFAAYHLALETSFLADEGAFLPEVSPESSLSVGLLDKSSTIDRSISLAPGHAISVAGEQQDTIDSQRPPVTSIEFRKELSEEAPASSKDHDSKAECSDTISTQMSSGERSYPDVVKESMDASLPSVSTMGVLNPPPQYGAGKDTSKMLIGTYQEEISDSLSEKSIPPVSSLLVSCLDQGGHGTVTAEDAPTNDIGKQIGHSNPETLSEGREEIHDQVPLKEEFALSPSDHQSILVSLSTRCVWKGTVCEPSQLFRIKYYGNFDKPLGRFLRDHLFDESYRCRSCDMPSEAHVHCYTHLQGSLTISVRKLPDIFLPGETDGKIWMWHRCLRCRRSNGFPPATRRVVMSDAAWGLSFGKFLELSFSNHAAASRVASCGHSLHKDCLRFYGFGRMVVCFRYASIDLHSVFLPPAKVDFNYQQQEWITKEANEVAERAENLFREIYNALCHFKDTNNQNCSLEGPEFIQNITELEEFLQNEKADFEEALYKALNKEVRKGEPVVDILEINKLRRLLIFHSYLWDQRLIFASGSANSSKGVSNSFSTRDKEKLCSLEKTKDEDANNQVAFLDDHDIQLGQRTRDMELDSLQGRQSRTSIYTSISVTEKSIPLECGLVGRRTLSDGQFPVFTNLSNTFDARWTGDSGNSHANGMIQDPSVLSENAATMPIFDGIETRSGADLTQPFTSALLSKSGDSMDDFPSRVGTPLLNIYNTINRNWIYPRLNDSNDNSAFHLFQKELEHQSGARFLVPAGINDTVIPIYDDEPTSIISYTLVSPDYHFQLSDRDGLESSFSLPLYDAGTSFSQSFDESFCDSFRSFGSASAEDSISSQSFGKGSLVPDPANCNKSFHARVSFMDEGPPGKVKYSVTCYFAKRFDALRRACCPSEIDFIRSLSRCKNWGAQGGKSNVFFAKSLDDRFIVKQVTKTELESFMKFAPEYFKYLSESIATRSPTCLAKILGIYQVSSKNLKGGKDLRMDVLVMENLLFGRNIKRLYDLKGSSRSRYNADSSGNNKVLLDQNLIESMPTSPIFVGNKPKRLLERAVWNDTAFLASVDVMDYSLLVGVDEENHELVLGIIDFMRQYTWDKHLETWVKASGILGGPKNVSPTVISPKQYKKRFRKAMSTYFLVVPDQWSPPVAAPSNSKSEACEEKPQSATMKA
ncbi:1-phosphatidylinositol-3-phosphate 5-kinase FAB1B-like [Curcuma longa]|uniref:1-phosphatidylinositol-3-phosphate 5-kinase FAB1B-like n=1 Tax=Curcuma longa TaxID=136217 RepID=UPI003D9F87E1